MKLEQQHQNDTDDHTVKIDNSLIRQQSVASRESLSGNSANKLTATPTMGGASDVRRKSSSPFLTKSSGGAKCHSLLSLSLSASSSREMNHENEEAVKGEYSNYMLEYKRSCSLEAFK